MRSRYWIATVATLAVVVGVGEWKTIASGTPVPAPGSNVTTAGAQSTQNNTDLSTNIGQTTPESGSGAPGATQPVQPVPGGVPVMTIGSSVAEGWVDPQKHGYISRAFVTMSAQNGQKYTIVSKAFAGNGVRQIIKGYPTWLKTVHPKIVVLSWGGLDDVHNGTTVDIFQSQIQWEIQQALDQHAVVMIVTPPVTQAAATKYLAQVEPLFTAEMNVAKNMHNPNVYVFDVFHEMMDYLKSHGTTVDPYANDSWHPNPAGHQLGGELFANDMLNQFGDKPIVFEDTD